jgi:hypothetical protein
VSANGQTLLFRSARQLTSYDNRGIAELYLFHTGEGIDCVSCNPSGEAPSGAAGVQQIPRLQFVHRRTYSIMTRNLSADGRRVFFDSPDRLVAGDHNEVNDVYEWEEPDPAAEHDSCTVASTAYVGSSGGCLFLISGGAAGMGPSYFGDASESGDDVFFFTVQPLVAQDRDELVDVYDARVGGGIASQNQAPPPPPCESEANCRSSTAAPPSGLATPGSSTFDGEGNPKRPPACKKPKVRKHGKCVRKPKKRDGKNKKPKSGKSKNKSSKKKRAGKGGKGGNS